MRKMKSLPFTTAICDHRYSRGHIGMNSRYFCNLLSNPKPWTQDSSHGKHFIEPCVGRPCGFICKSHLLPIFEDDLNFLSYICAQVLVGAEWSTSWESNKSLSEGECPLDLWCNLYKLVLHWLSASKWKLKNIYENNTQWKSTSRKRKKNQENLYGVIL
jgi:hypothetical protein